MLLVLILLPILNPARGSIFDPADLACGGSYPNLFTPLFPPDQLLIPKTGQPGDFFGPWYSSSNLGNSIHGFPYFICTRWNKAHDNPTGAEDNLYVEGLKPAAVYASPDLSSKDGYSVWTTDALSAIGIGFILRWRVYTQAAAGGGWRSPGAGWSVDIPPLSAGLPFYRFPTYSWTFINGPYWFNPIGADNFSGVGQFRAGMDAIPQPNRGTIVIVYGAEVEVRYVLTKPASSIYDVLDSKSGTITTDFVTLRARPLSYQLNTVTVHQTTTFNLPPTGTCTTGNVLVNLGTVNQTELPAPGDTSTPKPFTIELTKCPRVNIGYSFVAPNGVGYDNATGTVNLDSTATTSGVGIQVRHRNDPAYGNAAIVFNPSGYTSTPSYTRNWPQCQSQGTCTNNQQTGVNHTISMSAAIRRTGAITPGKVNASLLLHVVYP